MARVVGGLPQTVLHYARQHGLYILRDHVGTVLRRTEYHRVAEGFGGKGYLLDHPGDTEAVLRHAKEEARSGRPVLVNAWIGATEFRKGSLSM